LVLTPLSSLANKAGEDTLRVLFTGDILLDRGVRKQIEKVGIDSVMSGVRNLFQADDAVVINLECPFSIENHPVSKQIVFRADTTLASALCRNGVTHASLANNHSIDQGFSGLQETKTCLEKSGITVLGYGEDYQQAIGPIIIEKGGVRVAAFNDNLVPQENWPRTSPEKPNILNISVDSLCAEMERFHAKNPDYQVVAFVHWGTEFSSTPSLKQQIDGLKLANAGASAIIGHHPHVIQPMRIANNTPVFFSLGNFIFDQKRPKTDEGLAVELTFTKEGLVSFEQHEIHITDCHPLEREK